MLPVSAARHRTGTVTAITAREISGLPERDELGRDFRYHVAGRSRPHPGNDDNDLARADELRDRRPPRARKVHYSVIPTTAGSGDVGIDSGRPLAPGSRLTAGTAAGMALSRTS
jgi:hypothetical protein